MNNRIISAADMMLQAANIGTSEANEICSVWRKVVSGVRSFKHDSEDSEKRMPLGERLAGNTRVIDLMNGLKMNLPNLKITSLAFRVAGSKVNLSETYEAALEKSIKEMADKLDRQEQELKKYEKPQKKSSELPPELLAKFDSIRKSMLDLSQE